MLYAVFRIRKIHKNQPNHCCFSLHESSEGYFFVSAYMNRLKVVLVLFQLTWVFWRVYCFSLHESSEGYLLFQPTRILYVILYHYLTLRCMPVVRCYTNFNSIPFFDKIEPQLPLRPFPILSPKRNLMLISVSKI